MDRRAGEKSRILDLEVGRIGEGQKEGLGQKEVRRFPASLIFFQQGWTNWMWHLEVLESLFGMIYEMGFVLNATDFR